MKTSNKLLLGSYALTVLMGLTGILAARFNSTITESDNIGNGNQIEKEFASSLDVDSLVLHGSFDYVLDPNHTQIKVKGEENVVAEFYLKDSNYFYLSAHEYLRWSEGMKPQISLGIKGKNKLRLDIKDNAKVTLLEGSALDELWISAEERSETEINTNVQNLWVHLRNRANLDLIGTVKTADLHLEDRTGLSQVSGQLDTLSIFLEDRGKLSVNEVGHIQGAMEDEARLITMEQVDSSGILMQDFAKIKRTSKE